jgi:3-isopropylmalate/(R)-2-methylmalate dehydratase small subunit
VNAVRRVTGRALPLGRADVDTDQIIPAHWLKRVERTGYAEGLFEAWRRDAAFVMNDPRYAGATVLITGQNFGSGSSREHAVWALVEAGFRAVIAPSLADIFRANCLKIGLVPVEIEADAVTKLLRLVESDPRTEITVDVERRTVEAPGLRTDFALDDHERTRLTLGLDDIAVTLAHADEITKYESTRATWLPSLGD